MKRLSMLGLALVMVFLAFGAFGNAVALKHGPMFDKTNGWVERSEETIQDGPMTMIFYTRKTNEDSPNIGFKVIITSTLEVIGKMWFINNPRLSGKEVWESGHSALKLENGLWITKKGFLDSSKKNGTYIVTLKSADSKTTFAKREFPELK